MTLDRYTKIILTVLAVGIWVLAASIIFKPTPIQAFDTSDINIDSVGGYSISDSLPIEIDGTVRIEFADEPVVIIRE